MRWLHIAELVAAHALERGLRGLGLGKRYRVECEVYPKKLAAQGLDYVRPNAAERDAVNRIMFEELAYSVFTADAVVRMKDAGCDAVVLARRDP